jgi:Dihydrofolate reductase
MLYESMAWSYLFRKMGIPVPLRRSSVDSTLFCVLPANLNGSFLTRKNRNMKKIILYIAASIDGRIAESDGGIEWLSEFPITEEMNYGYKEFMASIDIIIMGGRSWRELSNMDAMGAYVDKTVYVVSRHNWGDNENVNFITENVVEQITNLRNESGKDIWLFGGGELVSMLLAADLVDEMQIAYIPVILGDGIPLFPKQSKESNWKLTGNTTYDTGIIKVDYSIDRTS